ncbi:hypothetical protein BGX26_009556 [Mortierella sp. AD094]|nr:hypothetical protein BGX26_009556 [Mortierella sp. AD094]
MTNPALPAQRFHSSSEGRTTFIETLVHPSTSGPFILWEHIQNSFKGVSLVRADDTDVQFMVGDDLKKLKPLRIRHYPDTVLEVIQVAPSSYTDFNRGRQAHGGMDSVEARLARIVKTKRGYYDERRNRVMVSLSSSSDTLDLYSVLANALSVYRLTATLAWDVGRADLQQFCDTVRLSNISVLTLNGSHFKDPRLIPDIPDSRFDPIMQLLNNSKVKSFSFRDCPQFLEFTTGLGQQSSSRLRRLYWEHHAKERESEVVRGNIVNLCTWFPNLTDLSLGCHDVEDMYALLKEPIRNLLQLSSLTLAKGKGRQWNKAIFGFNGGEFAYLDLELQELPKLSSKFFLTSGLLRRLTWRVGSYYPDIVQDIHDGNKNLEALTIPFYFSEPEEFDLFKRIKHLESLVLNRHKPLQVTFADRYDHYQTFHVEFRNPNKDFPDAPAEWRIQDPEPIMHIQEWKFQQYNLYVNDELATLLAAAGEQLSFGEPDLQIGFKPINDLVKLSTDGARKSQVPLENFAIRGVNLEASAWTEIIDAINFTELQGLFFASCNLNEAHFEQLLERLPKGAELRWLRFYSTDWSPVGDDERAALKMDVVQKATEIAHRFNDLGLIDKNIIINQPEIWKFQFGDRELNLIEPMIDNFEKFNSNTGWKQDRTAWGQVMQALAHFSFHSSGGQFTLCDLQGGVYSDGVVLTDPVVMSRNQRFGPTDLGGDGIESFFSRHVCNQYCSSSWTRPARKQAYFAARKGTTMIRVQTQHDRYPLSQQYY